MPLSAGAATRTINPNLGDDIAGQLHRRFCEYIRDDLEANFLYLTDGQEQVLLISLDLATVPGTPWTRETCALLGTQLRLPERNVIMFCTHTHTGPDVLGLLHDSAPSVAYLARLRAALLEGAAEATSSAQPARVGWALGRAHIGYNRRLCWADGSHSMYGDATRPDFTGLEGPDDPEHGVLFVVDEDGRYLALAHNNCCHATCVENGNFASADFPGEARRLIREALHPQLPVLYLQGASGDVSPWNQLNRKHHDGERRLREIGAMLAGETLRLLAEAEPIREVVLRHTYEDLEVAVRLPTPEALQRALATREKGEEKAGRWAYVLDVCGVLRLQEEFAADPRDVLPVHAVRVGEWAMITNPCELYCQFGLDIKRRSPAEVTAVTQLADGRGGYCPTIYGVMGGGYSGEAIHWARLEPYAGYKLVETSARLLNALWR